MAHHPEIEDLAYATSAGLFAEDVVFGVGGLLAGRGPLDEHETEAIRGARTTLRAIANSDFSAPAQSGTGYLAAGEEALDALQAALVQAPEQDVQQYLGHLADVLDAVLAGEDIAPRRADLEAIQSLFSTLGHMTLARANRLAQTPQDRLSWPTSRAISAS